MLKFLYIIIHVLIVLFLLFFALFVIGMIYGSLEMFPTEEQQAKVRTVYGSLAFVFFLLELALLKIKGILKRKFH